MRKFELTTGNGADDEERFLPRNNFVGKGSVRRFMRQVLLTGKETQERASLFRRVVADSAAQHGVARLERIEDGPLRDRALDFELHFRAGLGQRAQMRRKHDANHGSVCTSTERTGGRSRTIGAQLSPASAEAYTWPPVVPKYTPHLSSESTAIASRRTFT